ncbi:MAG: hypothetical protein MUC48_24375 [Leptolyngbya sp. Prado105]|jgi:hypothetical protein|nr:hypothetical protein [Leptolyngbya sp. Prado105]
MDISECYEILGLELGASMEEVEGAYSARLMQAIRQDAADEKAALKTAYHQIKEQAYQTVEIPNDPITECLQRSNLEQFHVRVQEQTLQIYIKTNLQIEFADQIYQQVSKLELPKEVNTIVIYGMRSQKSVLWKKQFDLNVIEKDDLDLYSFKNRYVLFLAFPIAMSFAVLFHSIGFNRLLIFLQIWVHEFGHATVAWFSGRRALPLPFGWTTVIPERSWFVYFGGLFILGLLFRAGYREQKRSTMIIAGVCAVIQFGMTWLLPERLFDMWLSFGGIGGEFYLSALLVAGFYFRLPDYFRWDFWRYPAMLLGANTFWTIFSFWRSVKQGTASIPWGSLLAGDGDAGGDMNQLSEVHHWSDAQIINTYTGLGNLCLIGLISLYVFFVIKHRRWILERIVSKPM